MIFLLLCIYPPFSCIFEAPKLAKLFIFYKVELHVCTLISYQFLRMLNPDIVFLYDQFKINIKLKIYEFISLAPSIVKLTKYFINNGFMNESDIEKLSYQLLFWLL